VMSNESEVIFHRNDGTTIRHHDDDPFWVVESYDERITKAMMAVGAEQIPSRTAGHLFRVNDEQLIMGIAEKGRLFVEILRRKRRQDSPATKARLAARMGEVRQHQKA
jgi:hypothetical protein